MNTGFQDTTIGRLWLGTAQFGLDYGVTNKNGRVSLNVVRALLDRAHSAGINMLDTASDYGESESVLGLLGAGRCFGIVTKVRPIGPARIDDHAVRQTEKGLDQSLERLKVSKIAGVLVHGPDDLLLPGADRLFNVLDDARCDGRVHRVGVSVYEPRQLMRVIGRYPIDFAQVPLNAFDRRFLDPGVIEACARNRVSLCARSVFLQGALLSDPGKLPPKLKRFRSALSSWQTAVTASGSSAHSAALSYPFSSPAIDGVVVGVTSVGELDEIIDAIADLPSQTRLDVDFHDASGELIDPRRW